MIFILLIIVSFILYKGKNMNEKNIDDINKWSEEILDFSRKSSLYEEYDGKRYEKLIFMADNTKDVQVVQGLMHCLEYKIGGMDQTIEDTLATIEPLIYYKALFGLVPDLIFDRNNRDVFFGLLSQANNTVYTIDEWETFHSLATEKLSKEHLEKIFIAYEEQGFENYEDIADYTDYPYFQFYKLFQKLLKEKSEQ